MLPKADLYVIGNALSRGNESVEYILNKQLPFKSGPEILGEILKDRKVAVAKKEWLAKLKDQAYIEYVR